MHHVRCYSDWVPGRGVVRIPHGVPRNRRNPSSMLNSNSLLFFKCFVSDLIWRVAVNRSRPILIQFIRTIRWISRIEIGGIAAFDVNSIELSLRVTPALPRSICTHFPAGEPKTPSFCKRPTIHRDAYFVLISSANATIREQRWSSLRRQGLQPTNPSRGETSRSSRSSPSTAALVEAVVEHSPS